MGKFIYMYYMKLKSAFGYVELTFRTYSRLGTIGFCLVLAGLNSGCSTPDVPYTNPDPQETAWYAYQNCLASLPRAASASVCDKVGTSRTQSSYYYTGAADTTQVGWPQGGLSGIGFPNLQQNGTGPYVGQTLTGTSNEFAVAKAHHDEVGPSQSESMRRLLDESYKQYLMTLDEKTLLELKQQWTELAASNR